jgi:hypothetical protein
VDECPEKSGSQTDEKRNEIPGGLVIMARMPRWIRKLVLTIHVVVSVGWIGIEAGLLALGLTGLYTRDPEVLRAAYIAIGLFGGIFVVPASIGTLVTGVLLSVGTPWGLFRHYWIVAKFVVTVALVAGGIFVLNQKLQEAAARVSGVPINTLTSADVGTLRFQIIAAVSVALLLLVTATTLSVYKPWGKTWFGQRKAFIRSEAKT